MTTDAPTEHDLVEYGYDDHVLLISQDAISAAERELAEHLEEADEEGVDRTDTPFCGCSTCWERVTAGYWISWTARALKDGTAAYQPSEGQE